MGGTRKPALALVGVLGVLASGVYAVYAARAGPKGRIKLAAAPSTLSVKGGSTARYRISIRRAHFRGQVTLWVGRGLPRHAYARFSPAATRKSRSSLMITSSSSTPAGRYRVSVRGKSSGGSSAISLVLIIKGKRGSGTAGPVRVPPFTIAGSVGALLPGVPRPLDLALTNPNRSKLSVTSLNVTVQSVSAPNATATLPCTADDFSVQQFSGPYPVAVPASSTRTLSSLGIPAPEWPQVVLLDRPLDQDGCKGASLKLAYGGTARLG